MLYFKLSIFLWVLYCCLSLVTVEHLLCRTAIAECLVDFLESLSLLPSGALESSARFWRKGVLCLCEGKVDAMNDFLVMVEKFYPKGGLAAFPKGLILGIPISVPF